MVDGAEIERRREAQLLTLEEAARRAGMKRRQEWHGLERGDRKNPTVRTLGAVADVLHCRLDDLVKRAPNDLHTTLDN